MAMIRKEVVEKFSEENWNSIVKTALSYLPFADENQKNDLNISLENAGIKIPGFRKPISAPIGSLTKPILENINHEDVQESVCVIWIDSQSQLRDGILEYLEENQFDGEPDGKKVLKEARSFLKQISTPGLVEIALGMSILTCDEVKILSTEEPVEKEETDSRTSDSKIRKALEKEKKKYLQLEERNKHLQEKLDKSAKDIEKLNGEIDDLNKKIRDIESHMHDAVSASINEWSQSLHMQFEDQGGEEAVEGISDELELLKTLAQSAINDQAVRNRRYGTVKELREKHKSIVNLLEELRFLKDQSIHVVPKVDKAIEALQETLRAMEENPVAMKIIRGDSKRSVPIDTGKITDLKVNKSVIPTIEHISKTVSKMRDSGLLADEDYLKVEGILLDKLEKIMLAHGMMPGQSVKESSFDKNVFGGKFKDKTLIIDGNNVILDAFFRHSMDKVTDFSSKREDFNAKVQALSDHFSKVIVVYDGVRNEEKQSSSNMEIIFTDKANMNIEADDKIVDILKRLDDSDAVVATDDGKLIDRCAVKNCIFLKSRDCYEFFCGSTMKPSS